MRAPDKNKNGLVIPPTPSQLTPEQASLYGNKSKPDRHHLYFPRVAFGQKGTLTHQFREHRFNSVWLPRFQHDRLHKRYNELVYKYPKFMIPSDDVMVTFLDEAQVLKDLNVCVRAVDMIDDAIYEGRVSHFSKTLENRHQRIETIDSVIEKTKNFEVITKQMAATVLFEVTRVIGKVA